MSEAVDSFMLLSFPDMPSLPCSALGWDTGTARVSTGKLKIEEGGAEVY